MWQTNVWLKTSVLLQGRLNKLQVNWKGREATSRSLRILRSYHRANERLRPGKPVTSFKAQTEMVSLLTPLVLKQYSYKNFLLHHSLPMSIYTRSFYIASDWERMRKNNWLFSLWFFIFWLYNRLLPEKQSGTSIVPLSTIKDTFWILTIMESTPGCVPTADIVTWCARFFLLILLMLVSRSLDLAQDPYLDQQE